MATDSKMTERINTRICRNVNSWILRSTAQKRRINPNYGKSDFVRELVYAAFENRNAK